MSERRKLEMTISLDALEHLGINLYSNIPAVLSEIVANAWDADASTVSIVVDKATETITIEDDGTGMDRDGVIDRFLTVGFKRREILGPTTGKGRHPMGRKGIGKLSIFSIAKTAVVYTLHDHEPTAFRMDREAIRRAISGRGQKTYEPTELTDWPHDLSRGTRIILGGIAKSLSGMTVEGLKRRVARRFSIIGPQNDFRVLVNGSEIGPDDRGYHSIIEYLWFYGAEQDFVRSCRRLKRPAEDRTKAVARELAAAGLSLSGWIGTVSKPRNLKDDDGDNLNRVAIFMRGKLAQEDVLDDFAQKEIYADYVVGELHCEELDVDQAADIATSSRQALKQDDPRYEALKRTVLSELRNIAAKWGDWRRGDGAKEAAGVPAVAEWLEGLEDRETKRKAESWIGRLNVIRSDNETDKKELLKASILAFENYRRKQALERLDYIHDENLEQVLSIFRDIDDLEVSYYGQIVRGRLGIIDTLQNKLKSDEKELVIRDFIFKYLWLLDPSWERVKGTEHAETLVSKFLRQDTERLRGKEKTARIDIGYRNTTGKHIIIELKRSSVAVPIDMLVAQVRKYRDGTRRVLQTTEYASWPIEIICLIGKPPPEWNDPVGTGKQGVIDALANVDARIVFYDQLLNTTQKAYADYLEEHMKVDRLWKVLSSIDEFVLPSSDEPSLLAHMPQQLLPAPPHVEADGSVLLDPENPAVPFIRFSSSGQQAIARPRKRDD